MHTDFRERTVCVVSDDCRYLCQLYLELQTADIQSSQSKRQMWEKSYQARV